MMLCHVYLGWCIEKSLSIQFLVYLREKLKLFFRLYGNAQMQGFVGRRWNFIMFWNMSICNLFPIFAIGFYMIYQSLSKNILLMWHRKYAIGGMLSFMDIKWRITVIYLRVLSAAYGVSRSSMFKTPILGGQEVDYLEITYS